jgi:molybdopterin molybdotransferase
MLEFHEARRRLLALASPLGTERIDLRQANGRVLSDAVHSPVDIPGFDNSAMDGYAVRHADLPSNPVGHNLLVVGESRAGVAGPSLQTGSAQRIFTGAPLPEGADTVVIQENVERADDSVCLRFPVTSGDHVRLTGEDVRRGDEVLPPGMRLGPYHLGLLASLDWTTVSVSRRPHVSILCTGDELRLPGLPAPNTVRGTLPESNGIALAALAESAGARVTLLPIGPDRLDALTPLISDALRTSDVLVTVGGVSVGDYDVVNAALAQVGVASEFWKVRIRPGKPLSVGRWQNALTLGLPGNPVSAQVTATLFLLPLLRTLQGDICAVPAFVKRTLRNDFNQSPGRRGFFRGVVVGDEVLLQSKQGSGSVLSMAHANALVTFHEASTGAKAGDAVDTLLLSEA